MSENATKWSFDVNGDGDTFCRVRACQAVFFASVGSREGSTQCALKRQACTSRVSRTLGRAIVPMRITLIGALWSQCTCQSLAVMLDIMQQHNALHVCISATTSFLHPKMVFHFHFNFRMFSLPKMFPNSSRLKTENELAILWPSWLNFVRKGVEWNSVYSLEPLP